MTGRSIITPWSFRDGKDYIITFTVNGHPSSLSLKVADKITAEEWTCSYDDKCKSFAFCINVNAVLILNEH